MLWYLLFENVCLFLFVSVKALLSLCYILYNIRHKIKVLCRNSYAYNEKLKVSNGGCSQRHAAGTNLPIKAL